MRGASKLDRTCEECGAAFKAWPYCVREGKGRYCGSRCSNIANSRIGRRVRRERAQLYIDSSGYLAYCGERIHRGVAEVKLGRLLTGSETVHHINGDPLDNRPENLRVLPSQSEHLKLHPPPRGAAHHCAKLTQQKADEIRRSYAAGRTGVSLAEEFGVSPATISGIVRGHKYINEGEVADAA